MTSPGMFLRELNKYPTDAPIVSMFEELDKEAFILLLEYATIAELKQVSAIVPHNRPNLISLVEHVLRKKSRDPYCL